ncbi:MAG: AzlD domain-containing protein [Anaerolineales bacterium]|jgi:branched-subunit amino acid transport protein|nr:AzlD domain-containing protein [Anaerolineales bacterium]
MNEVLLLLGMFLVTFGVRYPVLALVSKVQLPRLVSQGLKYVPPAVLTAIIAPAVLLPGGKGLDLHLSNAALFASLAATLVAWRTKKLLPTIVIGMATFWLWRWLPELLVR